MPLNVACHSSLLYVAFTDYIRAYTNVILKPVRTFGHQWALPRCGYTPNPVRTLCGFSEYYPAVVALQIRFAPTGTGEYNPFVVTLQTRFTPSGTGGCYPAVVAPQIRLTPSGTGECYPAVVALHIADLVHCILSNAQYAVNETTRQIAYNL